jgi:hypothetical protein
MGLSLTFVLTSSAFAATINEAADLFNKREESIENARQAAIIYRDLAASETNELKKANLKTQESKAWYFVGNNSEKRSDKLNILEVGYNAAMEAINLLASTPGQAKNSDYVTPLSWAYYYYGANMGKWGEAKGVLASLFKWPHLKEHTSFILALDKTVAHYGGNRILARAFMKVPTESKEQGLAYLTEAYENTLTSVDDGFITTSKSTTTTLYYLDFLKKRRDDRYCEVFLGFADLADASEDVEILKELDPELVPEAKKDIEAFLNDSAYEEYYDSNC